jgi:predicted ATPase
MIERLTVSNFRSLGENVEVDLGRFTVLVGPNGSGKSNVVDVLRFVSDAMHMGLSGAITHRNGIGAVRRWSGGHPFNVSIRLDLTLGETTPAHYYFELQGDSAEEYKVKSEVASVSRFSFRVDFGKWVEGPPGLTPSVDDKSLALPLVGGDARFQPLLQALQQISIYAIFPDTLRAPQKYSPVKPMDRHGSNWASILKDQPKESWKPELISALLKLTGDTEDIKVSPVASYLAVQFRHTSPNRKPKWFDATQESDGTLRVAGIVTALLQEPPVQVIGVEEPELTVHPGAIPLLYDFLKQAGRRSQVIVTTHSPELLDKVDADDVRVVFRGQEGTTVAPMSALQRQAVREGFGSAAPLGSLSGGPVGCGPGRLTPPWTPARTRPGRDSGAGPRARCRA